MSYFIPVSGVVGQHHARCHLDFAQCDAWSIGSLPYGPTDYDHMVPSAALTNDEIQALKPQVEAQQMHPISMGMWPWVNVVSDKRSDQLYLSVGQTGCGVLFKLHQS